MSMNTLFGLGNQLVGRPYRHDLGLSLRARQLELEAGELDPGVDLAEDGCYMISILAIVCNSNYENQPTGHAKL